MRVEVYRLNRVYKQRVEIFVWIGESLYLGAV